MQYLFLLIPVILGFMAFVFDARNPSKKGIKQIKLAGWIYIVLTLVLIFVMYKTTRNDISDKKERLHFETKMDSVDSVNVSLSQSNGSAINKSEINAQKRHISDSLQIAGLIETIKKKDSEITNLKNKEEYSYWAAFDMAGYTTQGFQPDRKLIEETHPFYVSNEREGDYYKTDFKLLKYANILISDYPKYPFGYFAKYRILMLHGDKNWKL